MLMYSILLIAIGVMFAILIFLLTSLPASRKQKGCLFILIFSILCLLITNLILYTVKKHT